MPLLLRYEWANAASEEEAKTLIDCYKKCIERNGCELPPFWNELPE